MDLLDLSRVILDTSTITVDVEFVIGIATWKVIYKVEKIQDLYPVTMYTL